jgi:hypothetical protein
MKSGQILKLQALGHCFLIPSNQDSFYLKFRQG